MPRRKRGQEIVIPDWAKEEQAMREAVFERERELVPVPVRREEAKHQAYRYMDLPEEDTPWYLQTEKNEVEEESWYARLANQLGLYLADMIYVSGRNVEIDQLVNDWLESHTELYRAILIGLLTEEAFKEVLLNKNLSQAVVNSTVQLVFA